MVQKMGVYASRTRQGKSEMWDQMRRRGRDWLKREGEGRVLTPLWEQIAEQKTFHLASEDIAE